jgi:hypothetical protein
MIMKKHRLGKTRFGCVLAVLLILALLFTLGACGNPDKADDEGINIVVGSDRNESPSDSNSGSNADLYISDNKDLESYDPDGSGQDLSKYPSKEDLVLTYPEYSNTIKWGTIPKDYIGGLGSWVVPKDNVEGYVNIREKPSISATVVGELRSRDDLIWWCKDEFYRDSDQLYMGVYRVKADDYTWIPVESNDGSGQKTGWVAQEVVELWGL